MVDQVCNMMNMSVFLHGGRRETPLSNEETKIHNLLIEAICIESYYTKILRLHNMLGFTKRALESKQLQVECDKYRDVNSRVLAEILELPDVEPAELETFCDECLSEFNPGLFTEMLDRIRSSEKISDLWSNYPDITFLCKDTIELFRKFEL